MIVLLTGLAACHHDPDHHHHDVSTPDSGGSGGGTTGDTGSLPIDTGTRPGVGDFPAACRVEADNVLRFQCTATLAGPAPVRFELVGGPQDPVRVFTDDAATVDHTVVAWGLAPSTTYTWTATDLETGAQTVGLIHVDPLPLELADLGAIVSAPDPAKVGVDAMIFATGCPASHVLMLDRFGRTIWYQDVGDIVGTPGLFINAMTFTEDQTVLVEVGKSAILEFDLDGKEKMRAEIGADFPNVVHHELFKKDGVVYAINAHVAAELGTDTIIDGIYAFDPDGSLIDSFTTENLYPYAVSPWMLDGYWGGFFPGAVDFTHTNTVFVDDNGDLLLSFRHLHAIAKFQGGPGLPGFGTLEWTAVGSDTSVIWDQTDFSLIGFDPTFSGQHDAHLSADGTLLMLDNGLPLDGPSRAVRFRMDEGAKTLTEVGSWSLGLNCPFEGSVRDLPNGDILATCTVLGTVLEYPATSDDSVWSLTATCKGIFPVSIVRAIPIEL